MEKKLPYKKNEKKSVDPYQLKDEKTWKKKKPSVICYGYNLEALLSTAILNAKTIKTKIIADTKELKNENTYCEVINFNNIEYNFEYYHSFCLEKNFVFSKILKELNVYENIDFFSLKYNYFYIGKLFQFNSNANSKLLIFSLQQKFPIATKKINEFFDFLHKGYNDNFFIIEFCKNFSSGEEFLNFFFLEEKNLKAIFEHHLLEFGTSLKDTDPIGFAIYLANYYIGGNFYFSNGLKSFFDLLEKNINKNTLSIPLIEILKLKKILSAKEYITGYQTNKNQIFKGKKFLYCQNFYHNFLNYFDKDSDFVKKFLDLFKNQIKTSRTLIFLIFKNNFKYYQIAQEVIIFNENLLDFETNLSQTKNKNYQNIIFQLKNHSSIEKNKNKNLFLTISFLDFFDNWKNDQITETEILSIILKRIQKFFPKIDDPEYIKFITPLTLEKELNFDQGKIFGIKYDKKSFKWSDHFNHTIFKNFYFSNNLANPGITGQFLPYTAIRTVNCLDTKLKKKEIHHTIDGLTASEMIFLLSKQYVPEKNIKWKNKKIGFCFDDLYFIVIKLTDNKANYFFTSYDDSIKSDLFVYTSTTCFKRLTRGYTSIIKEVLKNNFRVKGGALIFRKILNTTFPNWNKLDKYYLDFFKK
ncbi:hypothetical protein JTY60_01690 [symbiont of Argiope bruennichi]|uniref:hypothetical protein n=1 Tax=symbiont of Argiope bruennichi TaxID=2810479 RepID=UPI003DA5E70C